MAFMLSTLLVLPVHTTLEAPAGVRTIRRPDLWSDSRWRSFLRLLMFGFRVVGASLQVRRVVIVTGGVELFLLRPLLIGRKVVAVDWLMPRSRRLDRWRLLRSTDFIVVRKSDALTLQRRFGVPSTCIRFLPFPAPAAAPDRGTDGEYFYAAGWAHRDWPLLLEAQRITGYPTVLAGEVQDPGQSGLRCVGPQPRQQGTEFMRQALAVVLPLVDTELPSGPLVLLDAMAHAKAVIVSDVGGSRDYVVDGVTALLVPAHDLAALTEAMERLVSDTALRHNLGVAAAASVKEWTPQEFWANVLAV